MRSTQCYVSMEHKHVFWSSIMAYFETVNASCKYMESLNVLFVSPPPSTIGRFWIRFGVDLHRPSSLPPPTRAGLCWPVPDAQQVLGRLHRWLRRGPSAGPAWPVTKRRTDGRTDTRDARNKHATMYSSVRAPVVVSGTRPTLPPRRSRSGRVSLRDRSRPPRRRRRGRRPPSGMCVPLLFSFVRSFGVPGRVSAIFYTPHR